MMPEQLEADFDGDTYDREFDHERLGAQMRRVFMLMRDGRWRTLGEIEMMTYDPQASISARLRDLRKEKFGGHTIERQRRGPRENGIWEYRLIANVEGR